MSDPGYPARGDAAFLQEHGRKVLTGFYAALRALKFYPVENTTVQQAIDELHGIIRELVEIEGGVELKVMGDFFFLNETRLRLDLTNYSTFGSFSRALAEHEIGTVQILEGMRREEWAPFLSMLLRNAEGDRPFEAFLARLDGSPAHHVVLEKAKETLEADLEAEESLAAAKRTYTQSVKVANGVLTDVRMGRAVNVRKVKRAVQGIVDQVLSNEPSLVAMTTLRDFDEYTFTHSVNVCIFSVVIGQRLGLTRLQLYELGLGALFHDVGKMKMDSGLINKTGPLDDEEWAQMREHPTEGLLLLFKLHGFADVPYRQMLTAYEHHMKVDASGYPTNKRARLPSLFSRIVAVADSFDAATSVRSYQFEPWPPDEVLKEMRDNPSRGLDPLLVKALINATGVYPVGTLAILDTLELAVVVQSNPNLDMLHQPVVKVISDAVGVPLAEPRTLDLSESDPATGDPLRSIIKTTDANKYGVRVADYLV